jgi:hypothetical protein
MKPFPVLFLPVFALWFGGCVSIPITDLPAVGPQHPAKSGTLIVYSATEEHNDGDVHYYPHTSYEIYSQNGRPLRDVRNHISLCDETPDAIPLSPGKYAIIAKSETQGLVRVPVLIANGLPTVVNLGRPGRVH